MRSTEGERRWDEDADDVGKLGGTVDECRRSEDRGEVNGLTLGTCRGASRAAFPRAACPGESVAAELSGSESAYAGSRDRAQARVRAQTNFRPCHDLDRSFCGLPGSPCSPL